MAKMCGDSVLRLIMLLYCCIIFNTTHSEQVTDQCNFLNSEYAFVYNRFAGKLNRQTGAASGLL